VNPWLDTLIAAARRGDDVAARALVGYLAVCLERGGIPSDVGKYFAPAFKAIAGGRSADSELYLGTKSTRAKFKRNCEIAREVWKLNHREGKSPLRANITTDGVYGLVAKKYSLGADSVEKIYKEMHWLVETEVLEMTLEPGEAKKLEVPEEVRRQLEVDMQIAFAQLLDTFNK